MFKNESKAQNLYMDRHSKLKNKLISIHKKIYYIEKQIQKYLKNIK